MNELKVTIFKRKSNWYNGCMRYLSVLLGYLKWHYGKALFTTFALWRNFSVFVFNFFSIKSLASNFFTPWKRLAETYPKGIHLQEDLEIFLVNTMMRFVGMVLRTIMLAIGLFCYFIFLLSMPFFLIVWLLLPPFILLLIVFGLILIFSNSIWK